MSIEKNQARTRLDKVAQGFLREQKRIFNDQVKALAQARANVVANTDPAKDPKTPNGHVTPFRVIKSEPQEPRETNYAPNYNPVEQPRYLSLIPVSMETAGVQGNSRQGRFFRARGLGRIHSMTQPEIDELQADHRQRGKELRRIQQELEAELAKPKRKRNEELIRSLQTQYSREAIHQGAIRKALDARVRPPRLRGGGRNYG